MPDSLLFDGIDDTITCALGGSPVFGPGMLGAIFKSGPNTANGCLFASVYEFHRGSADGPLRLWNGTAQVVGPALSNNVWYCATVTKATGTVTPRFHLYNYNTAAWAHSAGSITSANVTPATNIKIGFETAADYFTGSMVAAAIWNRDFSDLEVEALRLPQGIQYWVASNPIEGWHLNTLSGINSFGRGGRSNETSRVGTVIDTGDVPVEWSDTGEWTVK